jgi:toxoflavin biosynthesis protein ToxC
MAVEIGVDRFVRHRGPVTCAAGIPGTDEVVTSGYDGAVALYNLTSGNVELLGFHRHLVNRVVVDARGRRAASASSDYTTIVWDLEAHTAELVLRGHADDVEDFVFVDDDVGASVSRDWRVLVWDLRTGAITKVLEGHEKDVLSVSYYDGRLFTSGDDMTLRVWDLETGEQVQVWGPFVSETDTCAINPLHGRAVLGCDDGVIRIFEIATGEAVGEIDAHASGIKKVAVSPRTGDIVSAAYDQRVIVWDAVDMTQQVQLEARPSLWERSINWSPDGAQIYAGTFDGTVLQWDAKTGECLAEIGAHGGRRGNPCFNEVAVGPSGDIALVSDDGSVRLAHLAPERAEWISSTEPASGPILMNAVAYAGPPERVLCGAHDHRLHSFDRVDHNLRNERELALGEGPINTIRVSSHPDFEGVAFVGCYSGAIVKVTPEPRVAGSFRVHENAVKALRIHPALRLGVSCSADGILVSWDLDGTLLERFLGHMAIIDDVDLDPTGRLLASVGRDFVLKVYELESARLRHSVSLGRRSPKAVCFFDEHTVIVTNYWGELIRVSLLDEQVLRRQVALNGISSAARSGEHLVVTSYDGSVYLVRPTDLGIANALQAMRQRIDEEGRPV